MSSEKMTAQQWMALYGWESAVKGGRFWLIILIVALTGVGLGLFAVPNVLFPGIGLSTSNAELNAAYGRIEALEFELAETQDVAAILDRLQANVEDDLASSNAKGGAQLEMGSSKLAYLYTIHAPEEGMCVDFLAFESGPGGEEIITQNLSTVYYC